MLINLFKFFKACRYLTLGLYLSNLHVSKKDWQETVGRVVQHKDTGVEVYGWSIYLCSFHLGRESIFLWFILMS